MALVSRRRKPPLSQTVPKRTYRRRPVPASIGLLPTEPSMTSSLLDQLHRRGLVAQQSDAALGAHLDAGPRTLYCGFDPTDGSLHIGHLVPLLMLRRFRQAGHRVVALIGGATGMIGDPSFKATERSLNDAKTVQGWVNGLGGQIVRLL